MERFKSYSQIKEVYDKGKTDIFWKDKNTKKVYKVTNIGSTILCFDDDRQFGMGAINNFDLKGFYGIEKPESIIEEDIIQD